MIAASWPSRTIGASLDTRCEPRVAKIGDRLGEIRLALAVAADEDVRARVEIDLGDRVVAEVDEAQVFHDHCVRLPGACDVARGPTAVDASTRLGDRMVSAAAGSAAAGT